MRLYGSKKHDTARCRWGCCGGKLTRLYKGKAQLPGVRAARKRARREGKGVAP